MMGEGRSVGQSDKNIFRAINQKEETVWSRRAHFFGTKSETQIEEKKVLVLGFLSCLRKNS